jgi:DNA-binding NarL/FixJ family response regulator
VTVCVVYDDRRSARERLGTMFGAVPGLRVIGVASADELIHRLVEDPGQLAVVGTQRAVPSGLDGIRRLLAVRPTAAVIAVGSADDCVTAGAAVAAGARGFLRWDASAVVTLSLVHALTAVSTTEPSRVPRRPDAAVDTDPTIGPAARGGAEVGTRAGPGPAGTVSVRSTVQRQLGISRRELQVLGGISQGLSNADIGRELYLSDNTVKCHARRLFGKLGVHERAHAVALAYRCGLFSCSGGAA